MDTTLSMISHGEVLEGGELTNLRWERLQLPVTELKVKGGDEEAMTSAEETDC